MYGPLFSIKFEITCSNNLQVYDTIQDSIDFYEAKGKKVNP